MGIKTIRNAKETDRDDILRIKDEYERHLFKSYYPVYQKEKAGDGLHTGELISYLNDQSLKTIILEDDGKPVGYVIFGVDPEADESGLIYDAAAVPRCDMSSRNEAIIHAVKLMLDDGMKDIHQWMIYDNFCSRFLYEQLGFRRDGADRTVTKHEREVYTVRYTYKPRKQTAKQ